MNDPYKTIDALCRLLQHAAEIIGDEAERDGLIAEMDKIMGEEVSEK